MARDPGPRFCNSLVTDLGRPGTAPLEHERRAVVGEPPAARHRESHEDDLDPVTVGTTTSTGSTWERPWIGSDWSASPSAVTTDSGTDRAQGRYGSTRGLPRGFPALARLVRTLAAVNRPASRGAPTSPTREAHDRICGRFRAFADRAPAGRRCRERPSNAGRRRVAGLLLHAGLVDRVVLKVNPFVMGTGVPLFGGGRRVLAMDVPKVHTYPNESCRSPTGRRAHRNDLHVAFHRPGERAGCHARPHPTLSNLDKVIRTMREVQGDRTQWAGRERDRVLTRASVRTGVHPGRRRAAACRRLVAGRRVSRRPGGR